MTQQHRGDVVDLLLDQHRAIRELCDQVSTATVDLGDTTRGWIHGPGGAGFIQVVQDVERGVLVGATSAGPSGGEVLGFLALAVAQQVPVQAMIDMPYAYPTVHRGIQAALQQLGHM